MPGQGQVPRLIWGNYAINDLVPGQDILVVEAADGSRTVVIDSTGTVVTSGGPLFIVASDAAALGAGRTDTYPAFNVDTATSLSATGIDIKAAAAAGGIAVTAISSGTDENMTVDAKGAGTITLNGTATGIVTAGHGFAVTGGSDLTGTQSVTSASGADISALNVKAATVTLTGTTQVTTVQGAVTVGIVTLTDSMSVTVDSYASLYVAGTPVAAGSVTATALYAVNVAAGRSLFTPTRTVASATSAELSGLHVASATLTLTGTTQTTTATGFVRIGTATLTDSMSVTVDTYAALYIAAAPVAAGSVTLTAAYAIWVDSGNVRLDGNLTVSGGTVTYSAAATSLLIIANTASAYLVSDGTTSITAVDTRNTVTGVTTFLHTGPTMTIAGASGTTYHQVGIAAKTITDSTATGVTALDGLALNIATQTINQSGGAVTITTASALYIQKLVAGSSVTITNNYIINTDVAGCFLTAAGVWTDASSEEHKESIVSTVRGRALEMLDEVDSVTFRYRDGHSDGVDTDRFGVIAERVPDFLASSDHKGVGSIHLAGYLLAVVKDLKAEVAALKAA